MVGGLDLTASYDNLDVTENDVVVDIGCGAGDALRYLKRFRALYGFDIDGAAIGYARKRARGRSDVVFAARAITVADLEAIKPTRVMMSGLLHHLADNEAIELLKMCANAPSVKRIATMDPVFLPGEHVSNFCALLDRGKYVRDTDGFRALATSAGLSIRKSSVMPCHPTRGIALLLLMALEPPGVAGSAG